MSFDKSQEARQQIDDQGRNQGPHPLPLDLQTKRRRVKSTATSLLANQLINGAKQVIQAKPQKLNSDNDDFYEQVKKLNITIFEYNENHNKTQTAESVVLISKKELKDLMFYKKKHILAMQKKTKVDRSRTEDGSDLMRDVTALSNKYKRFLVEMATRMSHSNRGPYAPQNFPPKYPWKQMLQREDEINNNYIEQYNIERFAQNRQSPPYRHAPAPQPLRMPMIQAAGASSVSSQCTNEPKEQYHHYDQLQGHQQSTYQQPNCHQLNYQQANYQQSSYQQANYQLANYQQANYQQSSYQQANYQLANYQQANYQQSSYQQANYQQSNQQQ